MIQLKNVSRSFPGTNRNALKDVNITIGAGEFVSIIGQSGAGKSSLLKMLTGEDRPDKGGEIWIEDIPVNKIKPKFLPFLRRRIGVIFQDFKLLKQRTVFENVALAMQVCGASKQEINRDVPKLLELVGIAHKSENYPAELSGGEQQRVSIARALAHNPILLIADEPTGNLDKKNAYDIISLLLKINNSGTTILMATHDQDVVDRLQRRVITLQHGSVALDQEVGMYYI
jgi:cell division transport system ATP-binding protein